MPNVYELHYTKPLSLSAARAYFGRLVGVMFPIALLLMLAFVAYLLLQGDRSWRVGVAITVVLFASVIISSLYLVHVRHAHATLRGLDGAPVLLTVSSAGAKFESPLGAGEIPWSQISEIWKFNEYWLLKFKRGSYTTIPLATLSPEGLECIEQGVVQSGGKIA